MPKNFSDFLSRVTDRNRNLITLDQQQILSDAVVAFFGMSVGSHAAVTWQMQSRAHSVKIADHDTVEESNLNRLRCGTQCIGRRKVDVVLEEMVAMNPYCNVIAQYDTSQQAMRELISGDPQVNVIVDEIDSISDKIHLRKLAREYRLPLISAADVGDNVMIDIERHDADGDYPFFHGIVPNMDVIDLSKLNEIEKKKMIIQIIGFDHNSEDLLQSLLDIGKTLSTWPQLGATATISGGIVATALKKILLSEDVRSGRYYISLDDLLVSDFSSQLRRERRTTLIREVKDKFHL